VTVDQAGRSFIVQQRPRPANFAYHVRERLRLLRRMLTPIRGISIKVRRVDVRQPKLAWGILDGLFRLRHLGEPKFVKIRVTLQKV
jgi:hypothetical protein